MSGTEPEMGRLFEVQKLEYEAAHTMLRHYDALNWQIGSILVAASAVLPALTLHDGGKPSIGATIGVPLTSFVLLQTWWLWFRRHRDLYNFRNETLHRLELELGMYHFLRVVEADAGITGDARRVLEKAKAEAGYGERFTPFYKLKPLSFPSGARVAQSLSVIVPVCQLILFVLVRLFD